MVFYQSEIGTRDQHLVCNVIKAPGSAHLFKLKHCIHFFYIYVVKVCYDLAGKNCCNISMNIKSPVNSRDRKELFFAIQIVQFTVNLRDGKELFFAIQIVHYPVNSQDGKKLFFVIH